MIKKAKKLGINEQYKTMFFNDIAVDMNKLKKKCSNDKFMTMKCVFQYKSDVKCCFI